MKKYISLVLLTVLLLGALAACGTTPAGTTPTPTTPAPTTPTPTTPAPTTPAPTTPAPTTPAPTTPAVTTPAPATPPEEGTYFMARLEGRVLTLTGPNQTITRDFNDLEHIGYIPISLNSSVFADDIVFTMGDTTSTEALTVSWADLDGILEELFGVAPSANTAGPKIAVEVVSYDDIITLMNSVVEYREEEENIWFFCDPENRFQGYPVVIYPNGRMAFCLDGICYMTVRLDPTEPFWRDRYFYGVGHTVDREALEEHLSWYDPLILHNKE